MTARSFNLSLTDIQKNLSKELAQFQKRTSWGKTVSYVYNPLDYAWRATQQYCDRWGRPPKKSLFLGMNPGPWGMAQTGVPFGEVSIVSQWMKIDAPIHPPKSFHPKKPVLGWDCPRSEVSGKRLWSLFRDLYPDPNHFFRDHFVLNYCPLMFLGPSGANLTPDKLAIPIRRELERICDHSLGLAIDYLRPGILVGVGDYAYRTLQRVLGSHPKGHRPQHGVIKVLHPSPASPAANRGWYQAALATLKSHHVL